MFEQYVISLLPELILIGSGLLILFVGLGTSPKLRAAIAPLALLAIVVVGYLNWQQSATSSVPMRSELAGGIAIDSLTQYVRFITLVVGSILIMVNWYQSDPEDRGEYFALVLCSMAGVTLVSACTDLVLLFLALELVSVPTYILVAIGRRHMHAPEAASKYFFLGALAAALTAYGFSFLYGASGTTSMTTVTVGLSGSMGEGNPLSTLMMLGLLLAVGGLCFKIAAVPFHGYVADVYQGAAAPLAGLLAFLPKLAGFIGLIKLLAMINWELPITVFWTIWIVAVLTMTVGNVLALMQDNVKRMLAYSSVAHSGYMLIGLLAGPVMGEGPLHDGLSAMLFYIVVYGLMNLGAFSVLAYLSSGEEEVELQEQLSGLSRREPAAALVMAVCMFSLMGLPPTAGFLGKMYIFSSAFAASGTDAAGVAMVTLAIIGVVNSAIAAAYYLRIVGVCYFTPIKRAEPEPDWETPPLRPWLQVGTTVCAMMMILIFIFPKGIMVRAQRATDSMTQSAVYYAEKESSLADAASTRPERPSYGARSRDSGNAEYEAATPLSQSDNPAIIAGSKNGLRGRAVGSSSGS